MIDYIVLHSKDFAGPNRELPDRAIDLMDYAGAKFGNQEDEVEITQNHIDQIIKEKKHGTQELSYFS